MIYDLRFTIGESKRLLGCGVKFCVLALLFATLNSQLSTVLAFEGRISATLTRGGETQTFLYTVGTNQLRIERAETNWPYAKNIVDRNTGAITMLFPHNRSFVRLKPADENAATRFPGAPAMPLPPGGLPPGVGPQSPSANLPARPGVPPMPAGIGPTNLPGMPAPPPMSQMPAMPAAGGMPVMPAMPAGMAGGMPAMPMMPMPMVLAELKATGETTNLLGYACTRYELKERGEVMEIWATDKLMAFQPYMQNQPHRFGPRMIEEQWPEIIKPKKLFPLLVILKFERGPERERFEVRSVTSEKIADVDGKLFQPPPGYQEIQPLPF